METKIKLSCMDETQRTFCKEMILVEEGIKRLTQPMYVIARPLPSPRTISLRPPYS